MSNGMQFTSFEDFVETLLRGNEVLLFYNGATYSVTPAWRGDVVDGFDIGKAYGTFEYCATVEALGNYLIGFNRFKDVFDDMNVVDRVF